jgi:tRNA(fMet)-specific endonuclease VapC
LILHVDTSFVVDLFRERRSSPGPATALLERHLDDELRMSLFVACELHAGAARAGDPEAEALRIRETCLAIPVVIPAERLAEIYGRILAELQRRGETVATMDLLIGGTALLEGVPLITRNRRHFERIPDLGVVSY